MSDSFLREVEETFRTKVPHRVSAEGGDENNPLSRGRTENEFRLHGPPGCGKSHALATAWVPRAAERFGPENVVICSLTKAAAHEIASRVQGAIPRENVGTLHALCYRALGRPKIAESKIADFNAAHPHYRMSSASGSVDDLNVGVSGREQSTKADDLMAAAQVYRHRMVPKEKWTDAVLPFHAKWVAWMEEAEYVDFTGLIEAALASVDTAPGCPAVFIVDESQDLSALELALVRKWNRHAEYCVLAGDGDQSIFGFRGASPRAVFATEIPEENNYHLTKSYRVPRAVHRVASRWIEQASFRYAVEYTPRDFEGEVTRSRASSRNVAPLIAEIICEIEEARTVMLLATCGFVLKRAIAMLREQGVLFHNEYRPTHGGWNPLRGGAARLAAYLRPDPATYPTESRTWTWEEVHMWASLLRSSDSMTPGSKALVARLAKDPATATTTMTADEGRAVFGVSWDPLLAGFESGEPLGWLRDRLLASKARTMAYAFAVAEKRGRHVLRDKPLLTVGTCHSTKGGEADVVFLMPDISRSAARHWAMGGASESRDSIVRTIYVGMTRAREKLVLCERWSTTSVDWERMT